MKTSVLLFSLIIATNSFANELHNFNDIRTSIITGKKIRIAVDLSQCSASNKGMVHTKHIGVYTPNAIQVTDDHITTSFTHFTLNNPIFLGKPIYEFVTYTINADNSMKLTGQILETANHAPISDIYSLNCKIDSGVKIYI